MAGSQRAFMSVSTNPAIDRVALVDGCASVGSERRGALSAIELLETAGGKAAHAATVAAELGAESTLLTTAGGATGERFLELLKGEPFEVEAVEVGPPTRGTFTVVDSSGDQLEIHEPSGPLSPAECRELVARLSGSPGVVAVCGSLPPDAPDRLHAELVQRARGLGAFTILDCSTPPALAAGLEAGPDLVAPNLGEAADLLGADFGEAAGERELVAVTDAIRKLGAGAVWLSLGPDGSILSFDDEVVRLSAPAPRRPVNAVGCGDALVGGLAAGLIGGGDLLAAARLGAAAAADKITRLHPGRVDRASVEALVSDVRSERIGEGVSAR
jgi:1-phosphofructokinase